MPVGYRGIDLVKSKGHADVDPIDPVLEADVLPKFNMHLYQSSVTKTHVKWIGKNCKPCFKDATTIAMPWKHHDSSVADPFPKSGKFSESDAERLHEFVITLHKPAPSLLYAVGLSHTWKYAGHIPILKDSKGKVLTLAEFLRMPNFKGCKVAAGTLLPSGTACLTHTTPPATRLEDIQPKTGDMEVAKIPCRKVLAEKEKKKKRNKDEAKAGALERVAKATGEKHAGEEGTSRPKKKKMHHDSPLTELNSEHVSSPMPINQSQPLYVLANEAHVYENVSVR
ncbi:hypothetical protein Tco_0260652 [Tanacetum coccineum]